MAMRKNVNSKILVLTNHDYNIGHHETIFESGVHRSQVYKGSVMPP